MPPVVLKVSAIPHVAPWRGVFGLGWSQIEENIRKKVWKSYLESRKAEEILDRP